MLLADAFYQRKDVVKIAQDLLGKVLCTHINGSYTSGMITETEAYAGITDKASHAYGGRRTLRNEAMYGPAGHAYVYLCYGIHHLFNVVTYGINEPYAVLIRAVQPLEGIHTMLLRRHYKVLKPALTAGPGAMSQALGIHTSHNGSSLQSNLIWIEDRGIKVAKAKLVAASRVGVAYAAADALRPYRFFIKDHPYVSKAKGLALLH